MDNKEAINWLTRIRDRLMTTSSKQFEALTFAIAALERQKEDEWHSVAKEGNPHMPENLYGDDYMVITNFGLFGIATYYRNGTWLGYDSEGDSISENFGNTVIAWRPLPEKYKAEEGAE